MPTPLHRALSTDRAREVAERLYSVRMIRKNIFKTTKLTIAPNG